MADEIKVTCGACPGTFEMQNASLNPGAVAVLLEAWQKGHKHESSAEDRVWGLADQLHSSLMEGWKKAMS